MKKSSIFKVLSVVLILFAANVFAFAKNEYVVVRSKNFQFVGEMNAEKIRREALRLEQFREALRRAYPDLKVDATAAEPTILIFKDAESFAPVKPVRENGFADQSVSGFFQSSGEESFIAFPVSGDGEKPSGTIFHEYVHFVVKNNFQTNTLPVWLNEGLAEYFQTFRMKNDRKAVFGEAQKEHLWALRQYKMLGLKTLSAVNYESLARMSADEKKLFYAESWAMVHFLTRKNNDSLIAPIRKFIALETGGETFENAFRQAFGATTANAEIELDRYVSKKSFDSEQINFSENLTFETRLEIKNIVEAEWLNYLGDLYLQSSRYAAATETLQKSLASGGASARANLSLGKVFMRQEKIVEAAEHFEKAVAADGANYAAKYFLADALFKKTLSADGYVTEIPFEQAKKIRGLLKNAVAQNSNLIEAYKMLASISLANGDELGESIEYVRTALRIQPQNFRLEYNLAQLLLRKKDFENARSVAENLSKNCVEKDFCVRVRSFTEALNSIEQKEKELAELRKKYGLENVDFAEENLLPPEEAMNRALNRSLRKPLENEKRFVGNLTEIVCGENILFNIESETESLKLSKASFDGISLISFSQNTAGMRIECGKPKNEMFVVATYKENLSNNSGANGEIFVLEFVPKEFKLIE